MCGIVGIVATDAVVDPPVLQRMNDRIAHRGPDGEGFMIAAGDWGGLCHSFHPRAEDLCGGPPVRVGLGHRRLAILDLSDRGLQPMRTSDGNTWLVFNGEIYNHRELKGVLESRGHTFVTRTDTEVLLHAYVEWGTECVDKLDGMYAFAVWDGAKRRLFCARDRLGIKPFYYAQADGQFLFASEIKALLAAPGCPRDADDSAAVGFLVHGNCDYAERTLFRGIKALPAAHTLVVDGPSGRIDLRRYWTLEPKLEPELNDAEHVARLRDLLFATVRTHLISDVRAGSCLSGGLDSSTVVGVMGRIWRDDPGAAAAIGDRFHTFTSCYEDASFDERGYALQIATHVGATPHLVFPSADDFWSEFHRMAWHQDMPFSMLNFYAQWRVMRAAKEGGVKVLLDGQGGDEVFGGYAKFRYAYVASLLRRMQLRTAAQELNGMLRRGDRYILDVRNGSRYLPAPIRRLLSVDSVLQQVVTADWREAVSAESTPATRWWRNALHGTNGSRWSALQRIQMDDIAVDTLPQLLRMEDRSSMAFSLEARVPLLDHKVVELGVSLPDRLKVHHGWSKFAVRSAMAGIIPEPVRLRTTKLGFAAPDRSWIAGELRNRISELLQSDLRCRRYVDVTALREWHGSSRSAKANTESFMGLFRILSLEMWMRAFAIA